MKHVPRTGQDRLRISTLLGQYYDTLLGQYYDIASEVDPCTTLEPDRQERDRLREAVGALAPQSEGSEHRWMLQTSNSFRRIGTSRDDGNVLVATTQPYDGHPDLQAAPGVLDYIVTAQPAVIADLLADLALAEDKLLQTRKVFDKMYEIERRITAVLADLPMVEGKPTSVEGSHFAEIVSALSSLLETLVEAPK